MNTNTLLLILITLVGALLIFMIITYVDRKIISYRLNQHQRRYFRKEPPKKLSDLFSKFWSRVKENLESIRKIIQPLLQDNREKF